jgi:hypothetical protein
MAACLQFARHFALSITCLSLACIGDASAQVQDGPFQFGLVGDTGYTAAGVDEFKRLLAAINRTDLVFVIHVGDFQSDPRGYNPKAVGAMPCVGERYKDVYDSFQSVRHPFILTPGDNDWTDCVHLQARKVDPLEMLTKVRTMFFPEGRSLGQRTIAVQSQSTDPAHSKFLENLRWSIGGVTFATLHIVGSNDNFGRTPEMDAEHASARRQTGHG